MAIILQKIKVKLLLSSNREQLFVKVFALKKAFPRINHIELLAHQITLHQKLF